MKSNDIAGSDADAFEMIDLHYNRVIEPSESKVFVGTLFRMDDRTELTPFVE